MTIEKLLEMSAEQLRNMTATERAAYFEPYLKITRPEFADKPEPKIEKKSASQKQKTDIVNDLLKMHGLDLKI